MMITQDHFASEFGVSIVDSTGGLPDHSFAAEGAGSRAIEVVVEPWGGRSWSAVFAASDPGVRALTVLLGTPTPTGLCVIERGTAFLGDVLDPEGFTCVETGGPVVAAEELTGEGLLLLVTPWKITAIDQSGLRWTTERIAIEGLRVDEVDAGWIRGVADPDEEEPHDFAVNLASGEVVGGAGVA